MQPEFEFWIDVNLPPKLAEWLWDEFNVKARSFSELGYAMKEDNIVFNLAAQHHNIIVITTKDIDFLNLRQHTKSQPKILYLNVGNISNKQLHILISNHFFDAFVKLQNEGVNIVEITKEGL